MDLMHLVQVMLVIKKKSLKVEVKNMIFLQSVFATSDMYAGK